MDLNVEPRHDVPLWNEARWCGCWNPEEGVGLYLHAGRFRQELDLWWVQVGVYLPDGQLCVDRLWGRNAIENGVKVGAFELEMTENGWASSFDGAGEHTSTGGLTERPRGSSAPTRAVQWQLGATAVSSPWDLYSGSGDRTRMATAGDMHIQQGLETTGWLRVAGTEYRLDGIGFKDHSTGVRNFEGWTHHSFLLIVAPEWTAHLIVMAGPDGAMMEPWAALIHRNGGQERITRFEFPQMTDASGGPVRNTLMFETAAGKRLEFEAELVHAMPITITEDNDNINGIDWSIDGDPVVVVEGNGRLTAADGSVAHCFLERSAKRSALVPPAA
jgi:hypothetical protein